MKKYFLAFFLLLAAAIAGFTHAGSPDNCTKDCADSLKACLSQTPATDPAYERARRNACYDRDRDCRKNCGGRGPK
jgi:hypothetical protein